MKKKLLVAAVGLAVVGGSVGVLAQENEGSSLPNSAQTSHYLSKEEALEKALQHAQVLQKEVNIEENEFDKDDGLPLYEIEFESQEAEYEYNVHAESGKILDYENDRKETKENKQAVKDKYITEEKALEKALGHAGVSAGAIQLEEIELSEEDGLVYYEIEFKSQDAEYEYDVDAVSSEVLDYEKDSEKDTEETKEQTTPARVEQPQPTAPKYESTKQESSPEPLTMEQARDIALAHAGVSLDAVHMDEAERDEDDGRLTWEFEFVSGDLEIEAEIDALTGSILDFEKEQDS